MAAQLETIAPCLEAVVGAGVQVCVLRMDCMLSGADATTPTSWGARLKNERWGIRAMPAYVAITSTALRTSNAMGWEPQPEVVLQYTQSKSKVCGLCLAAFCCARGVASAIMFTTG